MKFLSWNVNGIRAIQKHGFLDFLSRESPDFLSIQETKAQEDQLDLFIRSPKGYTSVWHSAQKAGYSGLGVYFRKDPESIRHGMGIPEFDNEGRVLTLEYSNFALVNSYFPNSQREGLRLPYKLAFCVNLRTYLDQIRARGKHVILCGDYNIAHTEDDLANPKTNQDNAGFLPEERQWMSEFLDPGPAGYVDCFRKFSQGNGHYTWWSYRPGIRQRNIGWRLDYHCVDRPYSDRVRRAWHLPEIKGSDHCPVGLEID